MEFPGLEITTKHLKWLLCVTYFLLSFQTQCLCDSSEDVIQPSNYYFSLPMFNFGAYFYVAFPNNTLQVLYDTFCDIRLTECTLSYEWYDELNTDRFPYYYVITATRHVTAPDQQAAEQMYSSNILCDTLTQARAAQITCLRLALDDDRCEQRTCLKYSVQLNASACSFPCSMLLFDADYDLKILYFNFGELPEPEKDGTCERPEQVTSSASPSGTTSLTTSTHYSTSSFSETEVTTEAPYQNTSDTTTRSTATKENTTGLGLDGESKSLDSGGESFPFPIVAGCVGAGVLLLAISAIVCYNCSKSKGGRSSKSQTSSGEGSLSTTSTDLVSCEASRFCETEPSSGDSSSDSGNYHTLDDLCERFGQSSNFEECDEQGYNMIQDGETKGHRPRLTRGGKRNRPLPLPPGINGPDQSGAGSGENSAGQSSSDAMTPSLTLSSASTDSGHPPPAFPFCYRRLPRGQPEPAQMFPPRPHRRLVHLEEHTYLGLVNLTRSDHVTEVKLVRTQQGHLELVDVHGDWPALTDYYTRLLLINQPGGAVGVVGLLQADYEVTIMEGLQGNTDHEVTSMEDLQGNADHEVTSMEGLQGNADHEVTSMEGLQGNADHEVTGMEGLQGNADTDSLENNRPVHTRGDNITAVEDRGTTGDNCDARDGDLSELYILYFGPVDLSVSEDVNLRPCDYLTPLDLDPDRLSTGNDDYLTVLDVEDINVSTGSQVYLKLF